MESKNVVRNRFKAPEGRYELIAERAHNLVQFHYQRCTRLCLANLQSGGPEDGLYAIFNVGELVHITRWNATHKDPLRSLALCNVAVRALPTCLDYQPSKGDGADLLVGIADGTVHLLSLRAQLANLPSAKPIVAATLTPEAGPEAKCIAVLWLPKSDGMFVAGFSSGNIYVYKRAAILGESTGRFSLGLGSNGKSTASQSNMTISGRGIHDLAVSPCGTRLAAACCDGALRILDVATGTVVAGFQSYYGAMLCCSFSPDGKYIAAAGEDDLVAVYSLAERCPVAHCQGHDSWVSRVQWDPVLLQDGPGGAAEGGATALPQAVPELSRVYRLASVGQDTQLCLWDIVPTATNDGDLFATPVHNMRKSSSSLTIHNSPMRSGADLSFATPPGSHHQRKHSVSKMNGGGITVSLTRADMNIVQPSMQHRIHNEPLSDILFTDECVLTADHSGCIRTWQRPGSTARLSITQAALFSAATDSEAMDGS